MIDNGRDLTKPIVPAKLEAYKALSCSASTPVSMPHGVAVIPDCETEFLDNYILLDDSDTDEPSMEYRQNAPVNLNCNDGCGMILPSLAARWSDELHLSGMCSGFCIRNAFCKGMMFPFDFIEFAEKVAGKYVIKDAWGNDVDVRNVEMILTVSMLKLWDSYKSMDDYMDNGLKHHHTFNVTKTCEMHLRNSREANYQFLQSYQMSDDDIESLIAPTIRDITGAMCGDLARTVLFIRGHEQNANTFLRTEEPFIRALMIDERVMYDKWIRAKISKLIRKKADRAKLGRIRVDGDFMILSGDLYGLCQSAFGLPVTGLLKANEAYAHYWVEKGVNEVVAMRAPMTAHNNIRRMNICSSDDAKYWYRYVPNIFIVNCWDMFTHAENGCDFDGDMVMSTNNPVLLNNFDDVLPIMCGQKKADKKIPCEQDFISSNIASFGNDIGAITNRATSMYEVRSQFPPESEEYKTLTYRIMCCQKLQQDEID